MHRDSQRADGSSWAIWIVAIFSGAWLIVGVYLFCIAASCAEDAQTFWNAKVACMSPNEMGDFLAGVFAPLAFLWLIAAVFLQKNELAAQRQELKDSREVAVQQVEEARRNVAFIEEQTKILTDQRQQAIQDVNDRQIDEFISQIASLFSRIEEKTLAEYRLAGELFRFQPISKREDQLPAEYIMNSVARFDTIGRKHFESNDFVRVRSLGPIEIEKYFTQKLRGIVVAMQEIIRLCEDASPSKKALASNLEFDRMFQAYDRYNNV